MEQGVARRQLQTDLEALAERLAERLQAMLVEWQGRFDLVVESLTVQSMPPQQHPIATRNIAVLVAPEGTLLVLATTREDHAEVQGPPWPLTLAEVEAFAADGLVMRELERIHSGAWWRAELSRGRDRHE
jgi:hypothetical protein